MDTIQFINNVDIKNKTVLLRADFDVSLDSSHHIANDVRIKQNIPTIRYLLKQNNTVVCIAKLGRPKAKEPSLSLSIVAVRLQELLPEVKIVFIPQDVRTLTKNTFKEKNTVYVLENIRFYKEEKENDPVFISHLASLGDVYVNDAFSVCHRTEASVTGLPKMLPAYGGLALKEEITSIDSIIANAQKPCVAILGGAKIDTKIGLVGKLITLADTLLIAGGLANTFFKSQRYQIGTSIVDDAELSHADTILRLAKEKNTSLMLPSDVILGSINGDGSSITCKPEQITGDETRAILDIGHETIRLWTKIISSAKTIIWNGPLGYVEKPEFSYGTNAMFEAIANNTEAKSLIGRGDTIKAVSTKQHISNITHVSTAGGAMLEYIEKGTLPGLECLKQHN